MTISDSFSLFLDNIKVDKYEAIGQRYKEITKKLNKTFRDTASETANTLQVGSYGRYTGIKGISDLDMLYIMPQNKWNDYKDSPQALLSDVRDALQERYPKTDVSYDRLVVDVKFSDFVFEIQPVFEIADEDGTHINYQYPDTKEMRYKITKPKQEQETMTEFRKNHGQHHRLLCKMARSWKNNVGVSMGGLLLDTLTYNFLKERSDLDFSSYSTFDTLSRDFLAYLKDQPKQKHYQALGSNQDVKVKHPFRSKAAKSFQKAKDACETTDEPSRNDLWREVYGRDFPKVKSPVQESISYTDNEEFIEDKYPINIKYDLRLDCEIVRNGFREKLLSEILASGQKICKVRSLDFMLKTDTPEPYVVKWKARNVGSEAKRRNCLRGEIIDPNRKNSVRHESADFCGPHYMECYIIKDGEVVARDRIDVPIE